MSLNGISLVSQTVEHQGAEPGRCKGVRKAIKIHFLHGGEAVSHDNGRHLAGSFLRQIVPAAQLNAVLGLEFDVLAHGHIFLRYTVSVRPWRPCRGAASRHSMAALPTTGSRADDVIE